MPLSYPLFLALYVLSMLGGLAAGLVVFIGWKRISWRKALESARFNLAYVIMLAALPLTTLVENIVRDTEEATKEIVYTGWIFGISGDAIRALQDLMDYRIVVDLSIIIYVWLFSFILYFTPLLLLYLDDRATIRRYSAAMLVNYAVLVPFYLFFPVTVTGFYAESGLTPLLYVDTNWGRVVTSVDPLNNDFPSGHVSIVLTTLLVLMSSALPNRGYVYFLGASAAGIVYVVLYLGVHWPVDVLGGAALAFGAAYLSGRPWFQMRIDRYARRFSEWLTRRGGQGRPG